MNKPAYLLDIPADEYHRATKELKFLSSHRLHLFRKCPALYIKHASGEIVEEDTAAFITGRASHTIVLEGPDKFDAEYIVADGPINPKTNAPYGKTTKAYLDWAAAQSRPVISCDDHALMLNMRDAVQRHDKARELLSAGYAETTLRGEWNGVPTQIRPDWYDPERNVLADFKTCNDVDRFQYDIRDFGYVWQMSYYGHEIAAKRDDHATPDCWLIAVEKREPFRVAVIRLLPFTIEEANEAVSKFGPGNSLMIDELKTCLAENKWPTRYEGFGQI